MERNFESALRFSSGAAGGKKRLAEFRVFDDQHYQQLNFARAETVSSFLRDVKQSLGLRSALDLGCGLGYFSEMLSSCGFEVRAVDGREENIEEARRRYPNISFEQLNAEDVRLRELGEFDVVLCFGLLYHLENPLLTIRHLNAMTSQVLLVESVVFPGEEPIMGLVDESPYEDQGLNHFAFYPTEACLEKMLYRAGFAHVYELAPMPDHPAYRDGKETRKTRTMLAAAHKPLVCERLVSVVEPRTSIRPWDPKSGVQSSLLLRTLQRLRG
jgi:SAM-dependent methyltransferase